MKKNDLWFWCEIFLIAFCWSGLIWAINTAINDSIKFTEISNSEQIAKQTRATLKLQSVDDPSVIFFDGRYLLRYSDGKIKRLEQNDLITPVAAESEIKKQPHIDIRISENGIEFEGEKIPLDEFRTWLTNRKNKR